MKFGITFGGLFGSTQEISRFSLEAERLGYESLWCSDSPLIYRDPYVSLSVAASSTTKIRIGALTTNVITRHPSVTAGAVSTLNELSSGRCILAVSAGYTSVVTVGLHPATLNQLTEGVIRIRKLLDGETVDFDSTPARIRYLDGPSKVPIYLVSTSGKKTARIAGRLGDGVILGGVLSEDLMYSGLQESELGAEEVGKDPKSIKKIFHVMAFVSDDRQTARRIMKPVLVRRVAELSPAHIKALNLSMNASIRRGLERFRGMDLIHHHNWSDIVSETSFIPDEWVEKFCLAGTPEDLIKKIRLYEAKGVEQVIIQPPAREYWESTFRGTCEEIMPEFK